MADAIVLGVQPFPQHMREDGATLDRAWLPFFAGQECDYRIIALTRRFDLAAPKERLDRLARPLDRRVRAFAPLAALVDAWEQGAPPTPLAAAVAALPPEERLAWGSAFGQGDPGEAISWRRALDTLAQSLWRRPWVKEYSRMYEVLMTQVPLRGLSHYLVAWPPPGLAPLTLVGMVADAFGTSVGLTSLPSTLPGVYEEQYDHLAPHEPHLPLITLLTSYAFKGTWGAGDLLHRILGADLDLAVAIDIRAVGRTKAELQADFAVKSRTNALAGASTRDVAAERKLAAALELQEVLDTQALHLVTLTLLVQGQNRQELEANVRKVQGAAGSRLKLMRPKGGQKALVQCFTTTPASQIDAFTRPWRMPSAGVATLVPFGLQKPDRTDGWLWMLDGDTPIMFDPFADNRPAHAVFLGKTGSGKSFAINLLTMRMAALGHRVIVFEPQGPPSRRLVAAAGAGGGRYLLDMRQQVNVLDVVATADEAGRPPSLAAQVSHVTTQLGVLLGANQQLADGTLQFHGRSFSSDELAVLALALEALYRPHDLQQLPPGETPILSDLVAALLGLAAGRPDLYEPEASALARSIRLRLTDGPLAATFNARTTIDWNFAAHDITAFDFSSIPPEFMIFYYGQAFGALNRFVRDPGRSRARKTVAVIDEFKYMAQVPSLLTFARNAAKTWRTFGAALWTADQDAITYIGIGAEADPQLRMVFDNAPIKLIGLQDIASAEALGKVVQGLTERHVDEISRLQRGSFVLVWDGDREGSRYKEVFVGRVEPTDAELRAFAGT